jgi:hypothetical protein
MLIIQIMRESRVFLELCGVVWRTEAESKEKHRVWDPYAGVDYDLHLCRLQHIYHGQPIPESTLTLCQSRLYPPVRDLDLTLVSQSTLGCAFKTIEKV